MIVAQQKYKLKIFQKCQFTKKQHILQNCNIVISQIRQEKITLHEKYFVELDSKTRKKPEKLHF